MENFKQLPTETLIEMVKSYDENFWAFWSAMGVIDACMYAKKLRTEIDKRINVQGVVIL